ncbi:hypothetical protein ABID65_006696 [Bradyrhizobium sp. S3.9.2]
MVMRRGPAQRLPAQFGLDHQTGGEFVATTIQQFAGYFGMYRVWHFIAFLAVTSFVFGVLVGATKIIGP